MLGIGKCGVWSKEYVLLKIDEGPVRNSFLTMYVVVEKKIESQKILCPNQMLFGKSLKVEANEP